ncbi:unnamed protein product, partial [Dibothriocephalus latus]
MEWTFVIWTSSGTAVSWASFHWNQSSSAALSPRISLLASPMPFKRTLKKPLKWPTCMTSFCHCQTLMRHRLLKVVEACLVAKS